MFVWEKKPATCLGIEGKAGVRGVGLSRGFLGRHVGGNMAEKKGHEEKQPSHRVASERQGGPNYAEKQKLSN